MIFNPWKEQHILNMLKTVLQKCLEGCDFLKINSVMNKFNY